MKFNSKRKLLFNIVMSLGLVGSNIAWGADSVEPQDYRTTEYLYGGGLDMLRAADAYAYGAKLRGAAYTGKGVTIAITDEFVHQGHPEFLNKATPIGEVPKDYFKNPDTQHGTHVAGTMVAAKDGVGMHGVAYNANILYGNFLAKDLAPVYAEINKHNDIKIINQSWGMVGVDFAQYGASRQEFITEYYNANENTWDSLLSSAYRDKLLVFCAHNQGQVTATPEAMLGYLSPDDSITNNIISVINLNPYVDKSNTNILNWSSNLAFFNSPNSISAPGTQIFSANSNYVTDNNQDKYIAMSGTSMAAPHVSGVGALVQEAFPYLGGKQLGDVLLSTATPFDSSNAPRYVVNFDLYRNPNGAIGMKYINVYYLGSNTQPADTDGIIADLRDYYQQSKDMQNFFETEDDFITTVLNADKQVVFDKAPYELVFGQGLVNAENAVKGLGYLDARRLSTLDKSSQYLNATNASGAQAAYKVNTMGFDSTWANDIGERRAEQLSHTATAQDLRDLYTFYDNLGAKGQEYISWYNQQVQTNNLENLPVGLWKSGAGTLTLSGANTYTGSTIADGGVLRIDGSVGTTGANSDVFAVGLGTVGGNGTINGQLSLVEQGTVITGNSGTIGSAINLSGGTAFQAGLKINGDLHGANGNYALATDAKGNALSLYVQGTADITTGNVVMVQGSIYKPNSNYNIIFANSINGNFVESGTFTGLLDVAPLMVSRDISAINSSGVALVVDYNLNSKAAENLAVFALLENMRNHMQANSTFFSDKQLAELYTLYSLDVNNTGRAFNNLYGGTAMSLATATLRNRFIDKSVQERVAISPSSAGENLWFKIGKNWGSTKADSFFADSSSQSFGALIGYDKQISKKWLWGGYIAYNSNKISSIDSSGENHDLRIGTYANYKQQAVDVLLGINIGAQNNSSNRTFSFAGDSADSKYKSNTIQLSTKATYDLNYGKNKSWAVKPYASLNYTHYHQSRYSDRVDSIFAQQADSVNINYLTGELGMEFARNIKDGRISLNMGYKRILSGYRPVQVVRMLALPNYQLNIRGLDSGRDFLTVGTSIDLKMKNNWAVSASLDGEFANRSKNYSLGLNFIKNW